MKFFSEIMQNQEAFTKTKTMKLNYIISEKSIYYALHLLNRLLMLPEHVQNSMFFDLAAIKILKTRKITVRNQS